jgi:hypothetical protein
MSHHHAAQSHSFHSSISSLPSPLAPPILPQFVPPKPEKSTAVMHGQPNRNRRQHRRALLWHRSYQAAATNGNLPSTSPWLAPRAVPGSPHGPEIATRRPPVTDRVNEIRQYTRCRQRTMGAWGSIRSCRLLCGCCGVLVICEKQFEGFCWGLEPQLLLVQQAEDELQCS